MKRSIFFILTLLSTTSLVLALAPYQIQQLRQQAQSLIKNSSTLEEMLNNQDQLTNIQQQLNAARRPQFAQEIQEQAAAKRTFIIENIPATRKPTLSDPDDLREDLEDLEEQIEELGNVPKTRAAMLMFLSRIEFDINRLDNTAQQDQLSAQAQKIRTSLESTPQEHEVAINPDRRAALLRGYQGQMDGIAQAIDSAQTLRTLWELGIMIENTERQLAEQSTLLEPADVKTISSLIKGARTLHSTKYKELTPSQTTYESDSDSDDDDDDDRDPWGWSNPPEPEDEPVAPSATETNAQEPTAPDPTPTTSDETAAMPSPSDTPAEDDPSLGHAEEIGQSYVEGFWGSEN